MIQKADKKITFKYATQGIFDSLQATTAMKARFVSDPQKAILLALSPTDFFFVAGAIRQPVAMAHEALKKLMHGLAHDATITIGATEAGTSSITINDKERYTDSVLQSIDAIIEKLIKDDILSEWYLLAGLKDDVIALKIEVDKGVVNLKNQVTELFKLQIV